MTDFILEEYNEKFLVKQSSNAQFGVLCDNRSIAHHLVLSFNLGTMNSPIQSPELFNLESSEEGLNIYKLSLTTPNMRIDEESDFNDCCQSGCSGCPHFNG